MWLPNFWAPGSLRNLPPPPTPFPQAPGSCKSTICRTLGDRGWPEEMKPSWLQCRKVTSAGGLGGPLPGSSPARGAGAALRALVVPGPRGGLGGRGCRALSSGSGSEYKTHFAASVTDPERFWGTAAEQISWYKPWTKTLENKHSPSTSW